MITLVKYLMKMRMDSAVYKCKTRYSFGWVNPRGTMGKGVNSESMVDQDTYRHIFMDNEALGVLGKRQAARIKTITDALEKFSKLENEGGVYAKRILGELK